MSRTKHGLPGIYNSAAITLADGAGAALALDANGRIIIGATTPGTDATNLGKAEDAAHTSGDVGVMMLGVRTDSPTSLTSANGDYNPIATDVRGGVRVVGGVGHDGIDQGDPMKLGNKAVTSLSGVTLVANGDRTDAYAGVDGVPIVRLNSNLEDFVNGTASNTDGTSTAVLAAQGAGLKTYLTNVTVVNTSASNIFVEIKDGTTAKWVVGVAANATETVHFESPLAGTANTAWNFDPSAATTTVYCSAAGFKSKV